MPARGSVSSERVGTDDFPEVSAAQAAIDGGVNFLLDEKDRPIASEEIEAGGVSTEVIVGIEEEIIRGPASGIRAG